MSQKYEVVIGLEVHVELATKSKMFCGCSADYFSKEPNTHVCPVCLGLPGALPVPNKQAIEWCVKIGLAIKCIVSKESKFDRKNYFYPDLAKGYQISQYDQPFSAGGAIMLTDGKKIGITRAHMEEDTGKLTHVTLEGKKISLIDFNRSGVPLVEIVTEPDFENAIQVVEYLKRLQQIVRYLGVSSADMERGDMRLEPNISLRKKDEKKLPEYKVEIKNINSFRFVQKAIEYEIKRQTEILESGKTPVQETRGWNEFKNQTVSQRSKEFAHDYRYFPEPDIPPIRWSEKQLKLIKNSIPELPDEKFKRFERKFQLSAYSTEILTRDRSIADFFEEAVKAGKTHGIGVKKIADEIINKKPDIEKTLPAEFVLQIYKSSQAATITDDELDKIISEVLSQNPKAVNDYKAGKVASIGFLIGQVQKLAQGSANPQELQELLKKKLGKRNNKD